MATGISTYGFLAGFFLPEVREFIKDASFVTFVEASHVVVRIFGESEMP